jgi:uncharacterized NAD(P)/FAD-binding protein YdhS
MTERSIAVIGGGASAALFLAHLAQHNVKHFAIDIYDANGRFGKGIAYSTIHDCHLLNVRAGNMSALYDDKDHFARWVASHGYKPSDFVPRKLYGEYLSKMMDAACSNLRVHKITDDVLSSVQGEDGAYYLETRDKKAIRYDDVILASGNVRPLKPRVGKGVRDYYEDPWTADFAALLKAQRIALIGSGLTAVDMALALDARGYRGKILIFSRNALLPAPHVDPAAYPSFLSSGDEKKTPLQLLRLIRATVGKADVPWQAVIDSLRPHTNVIWANWDAAQRAQFGKRLMTFWNVHRHRMAPQIAQTIERMRGEGRLEMVKAGVKSIQAGPIVDSAAGPVAVDAIINCLGYRYDADGRDYAVSDRLGPSNFGALFETTAIPEIRTQAHALAQKITA